MNKCQFAMLAIGSIAFSSPALAETTLCTEITALPITITVQGVFCLKKNINVNLTAGNAITINAGNVTIDFNGFRVNNQAAAPTGAGVFAVNRQNLTLRNGFVRGFLRGVFLQETTANASSTHVVEQMKVADSQFSGIQVAGDSSIIRDNRIVNIGGSTSNIAHGIVLQSSDGGVVSGNLVSDVTETGFGNGISIDSSKRVQVAGNVVYEVENATNDRGISISLSDGVTVAGNEIVNPTVADGDAILITNSANIACVDNAFGGYGAAPTADCFFADNNIVLFN